MLFSEKKGIKLSKSELNSELVIDLPTSKSISNRVLIMNALCNKKGKIKNLSEARDTTTLHKLLNSDDKTWDVRDAGTTMRFLTAFAAVTNQNKILTGTERMQQRPIGILVEALRKLGAEIEYLQNEGYPPLQIKDFEQKTSQLSIRGDVSSQYISAMLMIAPVLAQGLEITLTGKIGSRPYIEMTLALMLRYGIHANYTDNVIRIAPQKYQSVDITVEPDWSAASYWYSLVALSKNSKVYLKGLTKESLQGDRVIVEIMERLGVQSQFLPDGASLTKCDSTNTFQYNFTHCPDLAQTVAVVCAVKGIKAIFEGLESLKIKETDRVKALQNELQKIDADLTESNGKWYLTPSSGLPNNVAINTYEDHRMAMAFAPLCLVMDISFDDGSVVNKSYPRFWDDLTKSGISNKGN